MRGISIGIDIGTQVITTVVIQRDKTGAIRLLGVGRADAEGVRKGNIYDAELFCRALIKSAREAEKTSGCAVKSAVVAFSGAGIRSAVSRGVVAIARADGEITDEDVRRALQAAESLQPKNPNREIIHMIPREYWVDGEGGIHAPVGMAGMRLEVGALVLEGEKRFLQQMVKAFDSAAIVIKEWLFSPLAASEAVLTHQQKNLGVMLLDLGAGTTDYAIFREGMLTDAGVVPIGGERITHDIAVGLQTRVEVAEAIKLKYGHAFPEQFSRHDLVRLAEFVPDDTSVHSQKDICDIIQARLADIFELAGKAIRGGGRLSLPGGVALIGGSSLIPGIRDFIKKEMRISVERGVVRVPLCDRLGNAILEHADGTGGEIAVALGASLWHLNQTGGVGMSGRGPIGRGSDFLKEWLKIFLP